jgi:hypothetical protein
VEVVEVREVEFGDAVELGVLGVRGEDRVVADNPFDVAGDGGVVFLPVVHELLVAVPLLADEQGHVLVHARTVGRSGYKW